MSLFFLFFAIVAKQLRISRELVSFSLVLLVFTSETSCETDTKRFQHGCDIKKSHGNTKKWHGIQTDEKLERKHVLLAKTCCVFWPQYFDGCIQNYFHREVSEKITSSTGRINTHQRNALLETPKFSPRENFSL